jgi:quercetin dioxygenase-like cupin family protein
MSVFDNFINGKLFYGGQEIDFTTIEWSPHAKFPGVELKHLITSELTDGAYSFHLVKVDPTMAIGVHKHESQLETHEVIEGSGYCITSGHEYLYEPGVIAILPAGIDHEVTAGDDGLCLFAKFIPALL